MSDDAVLAALTGLNERLDRLEAKIDASSGGSALSPKEMDTLHWVMNGVATLKQRAPVLTDGAAGVTNYAMDTAAEAGIDPVETGLRGLNLAVKAASPEMLDLMEKALEHPELVAFGLEFGLAMQKELAGIDIPAVASKLGKLTAVLDSPEFDALLAAGALEAPLGVVTDATTALVETQNAGSIEKVGPFGAFFKLMDGDVQRAIGFSLAIAKRFGARLS